MIIAVTGSNGFLASNLIPLLLKQGHSVRAIVRQKKKLKLEHHSNLMVCEGQLTDVGFISKTFKDCESVIHIAAITDQGLLKLSDYHEVNVQNSVLLCQLAVKFGVVRFVFVSTANTLFHGTADNKGDESVPYQKPFSKSFYAQSKFNAESELLKLKNDIILSIVNPTFILGPNDHGASSGRLIRTLMKHKIWWCPPGSKNIVHVDDVCRGIIQLFSNTQSGERFLMAGDNCTYYQIYRTIQDIHSNASKIKIIKVPAFVIILLGLIGETIRRFDVKTELSLNNARILCTKVNFSNEKAKKNLNMEFTEHTQTLSDAVNWHQSR